MADSSQIMQNDKDDDGPSRR